MRRKLLHSVKNFIKASIPVWIMRSLSNSLHVAEEFQKRFPEATLVPMVSALKNDPIVSTGEIIGLIFPLHAFGLPLPVAEFLKRIDLQSASYIFAIATRGGSPCRVFKDMEKILHNKGKSLDASLFIDMPSNYMLLPSFEGESPESLSEYETNLQKSLDTLQDAISHGQKCFSKDAHKLFFKENVLFPFIKWVVQKTRYMGQEKKFYADPKCTGCGVCQRIYLAEKIRMENSKPVWSDDIRCLFCFACINYCPVQAVQIRGTKTPERGRYHHACADFAKIAGQKWGIDKETI